MVSNIPRFMITAPMSGSGKTTITCGLLKAFLNKKIKTSAFKSGPDYIDPMFHSKVIGAHSRNLDIFMLGENTTKFLLAKNSKDAQLSILEGAMGYYDGIGTTTKGSAYNLAKLTSTPVILCVNAKGAALSVAALIKGFIDFREDSNIKGVILNNVSPMTYKYYKKSIEEEIGVPLLGYMPNLPDCTLESRHLGLVTAGEIEDLQDLVDRLALEVSKSIDLDALYEIAKAAPPLEYEDIPVDKIDDVTIGVAMDKAFCFYYQDALDLLEELGAKLIYFSPLADKNLPQCDGIILGGGYPEIYAEELSGNREFIDSLHKAIDNKIPCFAECGGFMYLLEKFEDKNEKVYSFVGAIKGTSFMTSKLTRFGYISLTANKDNMFGLQGQGINGHEFHYSDSTNNGFDFAVLKASGTSHWNCAHTSSTLYAGYPHIHLYGNVDFAKNFVKVCVNYKKNK